MIETNLKYDTNDLKSPSLNRLLAKLNENFGDKRGNVCESQNTDDLFSICIFKKENHIHYRKLFYIYNLESISLKNDEELNKYLLYLFENTNWEVV